MSLTNWQAAGCLVEHKATPEEIRDLFAVAERDLKDSAVTGISSDTQLGLAYNAALQVSNASRRATSLASAPIVCMSDCRRSEISATMSALAQHRRRRRRRTCMTRSEPGSKNLGRSWSDRARNDEVARHHASLALTTSSATRSRRPPNHLEACRQTS